MLQVPTTQLAKMSIDSKFVELTADVLQIFFSTYGIYLQMYTLPIVLPRPTCHHSLPYEYLCAESAWLVLP